MQQIDSATTTQASAPAHNGLRTRLRQWRTRAAAYPWMPQAWNLLNRGLAEDRRIRMRGKIAPILIVVALIGQLILPDPVWVTLAVSLTVLLVGSYFWTRAIVIGTAIERRREALILLAGDELDEEFVVRNQSALPLIWLEVQDASDLPGYLVGRVVSCNARSEIRWRTRTLCNQRGLFRLGPLALEMGDPFRFFAARIEDSRSEPVLIHPKLVHLPNLVLPPGNADAEARVFRHLQGALPAPTVREHVPSEGLRHVHWPATAHHGRLMVRERQQEPAGDIWIVLDSAWETPAADARPSEANNVQVNAKDVEQSAIFERIVTLAASAAAQIINAPQQRKVGILGASGRASRLAMVAPDNGQAQLWRILATLAPIAASDTPPAALLREARTRAGGRSTILVVTSSVQRAEMLDDAIAELVRGGRRRAGASLLLVTTAESAGRAEALHSLLAQHETSVQLLPLDAEFAPRTLVRRTRRVVKSTPSGGSYAVEVEEER